MSVRIVSQADVPDLLPMHECIDVMARALMSTAKGDAELPLRTMMWRPDRSSLIGMMPGYLGDPQSYGLKIITYTPGNHGSAYDSHQGAVLLFDSTNGSLVAVIDASSITAIRTAAASGAATRLLARRSAGDLAILGTGVQARSHLEAMHAVRTLRRVRVWSFHGQGRAFAKDEGGRLGLEIEVADTVEAAVRDADLICTTTSAKEPVLEGRWLAPGAHVNAVGACFASARELDTEAVKRSRLFVDRLESALNEAGDFLIPKQEGAFGDEHILGEIGDLLLGRVKGRTSQDDITLFKSLGIAIEDLAAAEHIYRRAEAEDRGVSIEFGGRRLAPA